VFGKLLAMHDNSRNASVKLGNRGILFNNKKHEPTRKNCMEAALTASMRRTSHAIFSGHFVSFVVKKYHCHPVTDALRPDFPAKTVERIVKVASSVYFSHAKKAYSVFLWWSSIRPLECPAEFAVLWKLSPFNSKTGNVSSMDSRGSWESSI